MKQAGSFAMDSQQEGAAWEGKISQPFSLVFTQKVDEPCMWLVSAGMVQKCILIQMSHPLEQDVTPALQKS